VSEPLWSPTAETVERAQLREFCRRAERASGERLASYAALHAWSVRDRAAFWDLVYDFAEVVGDRGDGPALVDDEDLRKARFFPGARLNFAENLLHSRGDAPAIVFRGEGSAPRAITRDELRRDVARLAAALREGGLRSGDRVAALMPNIPETVVAMLAATSLGAVFSSCSPDFGDAGVVDRFGQVEPHVLFCADGHRYAGKTFDTLGRIPALLRALPSVERTIVASHLDEPSDAAVRAIPNAQRFSELIARGPDAPPVFERFPFDHPLYVMFSSGTTGRPKCIVHRAGGALLQHVKEHRLHCDLRSGERIFYFTTCGWMMWNWLVGALASGATIALFDGAPLHPGPETLFALAQDEELDVLGLSAKFVDACAKSRFAARERFDLERVRLVLTTGSPLAPEGFDYLAKSVVPNTQIASISGGTDLLGCFLAGDPTGPVHRGELQVPALGMAVDVARDDGTSAAIGEPGELVCRRAFPSQPLGFLGDADGARFAAAYFERFPGAWHHGDFTERTANGGFVIHGRSDAVLNPGGVRIGTAEIYRPVEQLDEVAEAVAIGQSWDGDVRVVLFVVLREGRALDDALRERIRAAIRREASPRHVPAVILAVGDIPRTRSGKISELAVRDVVHGREVANREALTNPEALAHFAGRLELAAAES